MSTVTLRSFEFIIPFGTPVQFRILDNNGYYINTYNCEWPKCGGYLGYEVVDIWPCYDERIGRFLMFRIKDPKFNA